MRFGGIRLGLRLGLGFGMVLALMVALAAIGIKNMEDIQSKLDGIYNVNNARIAAANEMARCMSDTSVEVRSFMLHKDEVARQEVKKRVDAYRIKYSDILDKIIKLDSTSEGQVFIGRVEDAIKRASSVQSRIMELGLSNRDAEALSMLSMDYEPAMSEVNAALGEFILYQEKSSQSSFEEARMAYNSARLSMMVIGIAAVLLAALVAFIITRNITRPVSSLIKTANKAASGDLTADIEIKSGDEIGQLARAFKTMIDQVRELVKEISLKAVNVSESARQLSSNAQQTSSAAAATAATVSQITSTVEQVNMSIQIISDASESAAARAGEGDRGVARVTGQMQAITGTTSDVAAAISELNSKAQEINQIVELIGGIAEQTNLLALNAAIEAARAGEQGRGFAVVAEEVRKLAEESAAATKDISGLIVKIQAESRRAVESMTRGSQEVQEGTRVVQESGMAFKEIISSVSSLSSQIQDVAAATEQMSAGIQNVAASTEEQTAAVEEVSASAESLSRLAEELNDLVSSFRV